MTIQVNKHFYSDKITLMESCLWCIVCILLTIHFVNYICSLLYVYILGIMLWLSLHSVYCILLYFTSCSIDNTNRVAKFSICIHLILCKKEQNTIVLYFKFKKHLKTEAYLFRNNSRTQYNSAHIILFLYNSSITLIIILLIAIRLSNKHTFIKVNAVIVEEYTILVFLQ